MPPGVILTCIGVYFLILLSIAWFTSRHSTNESYFLGNRSSPWFAVAIGLIGDSLSGVTFMSVPGKVNTDHFAYFQIVLGYVLGYVVIAEVLLPLYYRMKLTSIYGYLGDRFGGSAQKTGSFFFILSRLTGAAARLFLAAAVLQKFVFDPWNIPFAATVSMIIILILVYTFKGGIRTLVWTDTFQSCCLVGGLILAVLALVFALGDSGTFFGALKEQNRGQIFYWDWKDHRFFFKQFISGAFIAIVMTGLDQNSMQKNLSCRTLSGARKNIYAFTIIMLVVNWLFLYVGALLYGYQDSHPGLVIQRSDELFPTLALRHLGWIAGIGFVIGLTAATFSSADSVLTTLTTSFCVDFLGMGKDSNAWSEQRQARTRHVAHITFAVLLLGVILLFRQFSRLPIIDAVLGLATYTYGPLLGLFAVGLFTRWRPRPSAIPVICLLAPAATYGLQKWITTSTGYKFSFELLLLNGLITALGLMVINQRKQNV